MNEEKTWRTQEQEECWSFRYYRYNDQGNAVGVTIIVKNGTPELIEAIKEAYANTEGRESK